MNLGRAVLSEHASTKIPTSYNPDCPSHFDEVAIKRVFEELFEEPKKVNIYTGNILFVGESVPWSMTLTLLRDAQTQSYSCWINIIPPILLW
jgi:hypothetical protein